MTGYTVHTGTSKKFASGWDSIFGGSPPAKKTAKSGDGGKSPQSKAKKKTAKKKTTKKKPG